MQGSPRCRYSIPWVQVEGIQFRNGKKTMYRRVIGIYSIQIDGSDMIYVGRSRNIRSRMKLHCLKLRNGKHHCQKLQTIFDSLNRPPMTFTILEEQQEDGRKLRFREALWIYKYRRIGKSLNAETHLNLIRHLPRYPIPRLHKNAITIRSRPNGETRPIE